MSSANDSPVRSQFQRASSLRNMQQPFSQDKKPQSPFKIKAYEPVNFSDSMFAKQNG